MNVTPEQWDACLAVLQEVSAQPDSVAHEERFKSLISKIYRQGRKSTRQQTTQERHQQTRQLREKTGLLESQQRPARPDSVPVPAILPPTLTTQELPSPQNCYICRADYNRLHSFYHLLCPSCAAFNYEKRGQCADLHGRTALVTGGRSKIGYQVALRLLRDGARVIVTTRFPRSAAMRFSREPDCSLWHERLTLHGLDLRNLKALEEFTRLLCDTEPALNIIVNNAAQTIKRPLEFYRSALAEEAQSGQPLPPLAQNMLVAGNLSARPFLLEARSDYRGHPTDFLPEHFPLQQYDADGHSQDLRPQTSWRLKLNEVSTLEAAETYLVNALAPFVLNSRLYPLLLRSPFARRFIVNVSAMEGQFARASKTAFHPHTNMAKAALNMLTRTSAADYAAVGIYMNSVDTGWITDENPYPVREHLQKDKGFYPPLDITDGMARIYDPIAQGVNQPDTPLYGHFLKDYAPYDW